MGATPAKSVAFAISGRVTREDLPALSDRALRLLEEAGADTVQCDVSDAECDAVTVDALARLQLATRRSGCRMELRGACPDLLALLDFVGLGDVLARGPARAPKEQWSTVADTATKEGGERWPTRASG